MPDFRQGGRAEAGSAGQLAAEAPDSAPNFNLQWESAENRPIGACFRAEAEGCTALREKRPGIMPEGPWRSYCKLKFGAESGASAASRLRGGASCNSRRIPLRVSECSRGCAPAASHSPRRRKGGARPGGRHRGQRALTVLAPGGARRPHNAARGGKTTKRGRAKPPKRPATESATPCHAPQGAQPAAAEGRSEVKRKSSKRLQARAIFASSGALPSTRAVQAHCFIDGLCGWCWRAPSSVAAGGAAARRRSETGGNPAKRPVTENRTRVTLDGASR